MNLFDIASKHGIPEENYFKGANAMKAQYDELLKGLVVDEEAIAKIITLKCKEIHAEWWELDAKEHAKALANSTEIIKKEDE